MLLELLDPSKTYVLLLIVHALHLLHHRLTKRHISFAEVISAAVLIYQPRWNMAPDWVVMGTHLLLALIQVIGSSNIRKFSPDWSRE